MRTSKLILIISFVFLVWTLSFSQIREFGDIQGNVVDSQGSPLPGTEVSISGEALIGGTRTFITDINGFYKFPSLPGGEYILTAELTGFVRNIRKGIKLFGVKTLIVDFVLGDKKLEEEVIVTAPSPQLDIKSSTPAGHVMEEEYLISAPVQRRGMDAYMKLMPLSDGDVVCGSSYAESSVYSIDGVNVTDMFEGSTNTFPSLTGIKEVEFKALGLPAEYGGFAGGVINALTRSGSNRFSGMSIFYYRGREWNSNNRNKIPIDEWIEPETQAQRYKTNPLLDIASQVGGPIVQDKLWFFISGSYDKSNSYISFPYGYNTWSKKLLSKLTFAASRRDRLNLTLEYDKQGGNDLGAGPLVAEETVYDRKQPGGFASLSWTSIFSQRTYLDAKVAYNRKRRSNMPKQGKEVPSYWDMGTGYSWGSAGAWENEFWNTQVSAHLSHYIPEFIVGSHEIKLGGDAQFITCWSSVNYPEIEYTYYFGEPLEKSVSTYFRYDHHYRIWTGFIQDQWSPSKRLTLNLGLRYARYWYNIPPPGVGVIYNTGNFMPRIGFTFDILGDRKNVFKFHYGHYNDVFNRSYFSSHETRRPNVDYYNWDGSEWVYDSTYEFRKWIEMAPGAKHPYQTEITASFERELFRDGTLTVAYYNRDLKRALGIVDMTSTWALTDTINPGPDGIEGTADDKPFQFYYQTSYDPDALALVTNVEKGMSPAVLDDPKRNSWGLTVIFRKRYSNGWQLLCSYLYSRAKANTWDGLTDIGESPNNFINAYGYGSTWWSQPHQAKVSGVILLPLGIKFGFQARYTSGHPVGPMFEVLTAYGWQEFKPQPWGTELNQPFKVADIRLMKEFKVLRGTLAVGLNIDNVFNFAQTPWTHFRYQYYGENYKKVLRVDTPRTGNIHLRYIF